MTKGRRGGLPSSPFKVPDVEPVGPPPRGRPIEPSLFRRVGHNRVDADIFAAEAAVAECHAAVLKREQRVVLADSDIGAGIPAGTALTHDDVAGANRFAAELLHAEALRLAVAAVAG